MKKILIVFSALISMTCKNDCKRCISQAVVEPIDFHDNKYPKVYLSEFEACGAQSVYYDNLVTKDTIDSGNFHLLRTIRTECP
jgi:hypothetical protein